jgi:4-hydroxy-4-methyl-2-oxoglutarate aldolase
MSKEISTEESELYKLMKTELYTPVLGDVLDRMGYIHQFMPQAIQPMNTDMKIAGRAMPVLMMDIYEEPEKPFGLLTESLDQLAPGEVYVATGGDMRCAYWGEILTATARMRGAVGAIVNGFHRDTPKVLEQNWPVFSRGRYAQDTRVRMQIADFRCPVEIEGVAVKPGDLIFADLDGVIVIPAEVEKEVIEQSLEKARMENVVRKEVENGMPSTEAFQKYGVL